MLRYLINVRVLLTSRKLALHNSGIMGPSINNKFEKTHTSYNNVISKVNNNNIDVNDDYDDDENIFMKTSFNNIEWGGPLRNGNYLEPTRFGDWEKKGRCTDY